MKWLRVSPSLFGLLSAGQVKSGGSGRDQRYRRRKKSTDLSLISASASPGNNRRSLVAFVCCCLFGAQSLLAASGTWIASGSGTWGVPANWAGNIVADGAGSTADFSQVDITAARTITLDTSRTIGNLIFADATTPSHDTTLSGTGTLTLSVSSGTPNVGVNNQATTISVVVAGTQGLTKTGSGTLILSGNSTYTGTTTISAGVLQLGSGGASGSVGSASIVNNAALVVNRSDAYTYSGVISGSGTLSKAGSGTLTLSGANTFTGTTVISAGVLIASHANSLGSTTAGTTVSSGAELRLGITGISEPVTLNGTGTSGGGALRNISGNKTFSGTVTLGSDGVSIRCDANLLTWNGSFSESSFNVSIGGSGNHRFNIGSPGLNTTGTFSKDGTGYFQVEAPIACGAFNFNDGILILRGRSSHFGGGTATVTIGAAADEIRTINSEPQSWANPIVLNRAGLPINLGTTDSTTSPLTLSGVISGTGGIALSCGGGSKLTLSGDSANTYSGATTVMSGLLELSKSAGVDAVAGDLIINLGATVKLLQANQIKDTSDLTVNGTLDLNGNDESFDGLSGGGTVDTVGVGTLTLAVGAGHNSTTFSGAIKNTSGTLALTKIGTGTLTLGGANTYSGNTAINAGTLKLGASGSIANSPVISVASGATFDVSAVSGFAIGTAQTLTGNGTVVGSVTINGTVSPGTSVGTLTTGAETWNGGGKYVWEINDADTPGGWDKLNAGANSINVAADSANKFTLELKTLSGSAPGLAADFDPDQNYTWQIAAAGSVQNFAAMDFTINDAAFQNDLKGGTFAVESASGGINLKFVRNQGPVAGTRNVVRNRGATLKIKVSDLLAENTSDPDGDGRELVDVGVDTAPSHGSVSVSGGYILYVPDDLNSTDSDSFSYKVKDVRGYRSGDTVRTAVGSINVSVAGAATGTVTIQQSGGGQVTLRFYGIPGYQYVIQRSCGDLNSWVDLTGALTAASNGLIEYTDTPGGGCDPAFYRVRQY